MCGRPLDPPSASDHSISRMKDLLGADSAVTAEDREDTPHTTR
jgi:hypothetical protein